MAIPNDTPATAIELTMPANFSLDLSEMDPAKGAWYKYTVPVRVYYIGCKVLTNSLSIGGLYPFTDAGITPQGLICDYEDPIQVPVTPGHTYYFQVQVNDTGPLIADFGIHSSPISAVQAGDLCVNDDTDGFPALAFKMDGSVRCALPLPAGEQADVAYDDGTIVMGDRVNAQNINGYDVNLNLLFSIVNPFSSAATNVSYDQVSRFFLCQPGIGGSNRTVKTINKAGTVGGTTWTLSSNNVGFIAANVGGTKLYWQEQGVNKPIKIWNLLTDSADADLAPGIAGYIAEDILVQANGNILVGYLRQTPPSDNFVIRYSPAGAILNTYVGSDGTTLNFDHICRALDDPNSFWLWLEGGTHPQNATFRNIKISDGSTIQTFNKIIFENGYATEGPTPEYFGPSASCPFWIFPFSMTVPTGTLTVSKLTTPYFPSQDFEIAVSDGTVPPLSS
jgi:hypothetical protein